MTLIAFICKKIHKNYSWTPTPPIENSNSTKNISDYPKDFEIDFENNHILSRYVTGEKAIIQRIKLFVLTERNRYPIYSDKYGIEEAITIFTTKSIDEFSRQCANISQQLMEFESEWIQKIYKISRKRNTLIIEIKVKGKPDTLKCEVNNINKKAMTR